MGIFDRFKKKEEEKEDIKEEKKEEPKEINTIEDLNNFMLSDIKEEQISEKATKISLQELREISPIAIPVADTIKTIIENSNQKDCLFRVTNLGKNDSLKAFKNGYCGYIKKSDGTSVMAKLKEVDPSKALQIDPATMMIAVALFGIEKELGEIKEISKKILSFLETSRESQIESDLELLNGTIENLRFNLENEKFINAKLDQVLDINRKANENLKSYKKEIREELLKDKLFTTNSSMNSILDLIQKKFRYYRLNLYNYALSLYLEIYLEGNYNEAYILNKKKELVRLNDEYLEDYNLALEYVKKNADKSLKGNVLSGLGSAGKAIGNLAEKANAKSIDNWLNEKGDNLKQSSKDIKESFANQFSEMKESKIQIYINQMDYLNKIIYKTQEIYFNSHYVYFDEENEKQVMTSTNN